MKKYDIEVLSYDDVYQANVLYDDESEHTIKTVYTFRANNFYDAMIMAYSKRKELLGLTGETIQTLDKVISANDILNYVNGDTETGARYSPYTRMVIEDIIRNVPGVF